MFGALGGFAGLNGGGAALSNNTKLPQVAALSNGAVLGGVGGLNGGGAGLSNNTTLLKVLHYQMVL